MTQMIHFCFHDLLFISRPNPSMKIWPNKPNNRPEFELLAYIKANNGIKFMNRGLAHGNIS